MTSNGGKDGQTITDMFRRDAYNEQTLGILRKMVDAVNETSLPSQALPDLAFEDDSKGAAGPRLQQGRTPEQIFPARAAQDADAMAVAIKEAPAVTEVRDAVSAMQVLLKANETAETAENEQASTVESKADRAEEVANQEFDLFQLG